MHYRKVIDANFSFANYKGNQFIVLILNRNGFINVHKFKAITLMAPILKSLPAIIPDKAIKEAIQSCVTTTQMHSDQVFVSINSKLNSKSNPMINAITTDVDVSGLYVHPIIFESLLFQAINSTQVKYSSMPSSIIQVKYLEDLFVLDSVTIDKYINHKTCIILNEHCDVILLLKLNSTCYVLIKCTKSSAASKIALFLGAVTVLNMQVHDGNMLFDTIMYRNQIDSSIFDLEHSKFGDQYNLSLKPTKNESEMLYVIISSDLHLNKMLKM